MKLIDADALKQFAKEIYFSVGKWIPEAAVDAAPTVDAVPVVRCRDCEYWETHFRTVGRKYGDCLNLERGTRADFYCGWGSRKDETD